mmetsp:Transcript_8627/g.21554  ORF Transcript_8627/g.21554 Transcript_8627/m.21554 type:complete len:224 (-) Transcript_8627:1031-1702(-)
MAAGAKGLAQVLLAVGAQATGVFGVWCVGAAVVAAVAVGGAVEAEYALLPFDAASAGAASAAAVALLEAEARGQSLAGALIAAAAVPVGAAVHAGGVPVPALGAADAGAAVGSAAAVASRLALGARLTLAAFFPAHLLPAAAAAAHSQDQPLCFPPYFQLPPLLASLRHHPCHQLHKSQHENRPLSHSPPLLHPCYPLCHRRPFHAHCHLHHHACASLPQLSP